MFNHTAILQIRYRTVCKISIPLSTNLDDGIVAVAGKEAAERASRKVREDLVRAGLVEYSAKCAWKPSQQAKWLGFNLDLVQGR